MLFGCMYVEDKWVSRPSIFISKPLISIVHENYILVFNQNQEMKCQITSTLAPFIQWIFLG